MPVTDHTCANVHAKVPCANTTDISSSEQCHEHTSRILHSPHHAMNMSHVDKQSSCATWQAGLQHPPNAGLPCLLSHCQLSCSLHQMLCHPLGPGNALVVPAIPGGRDFPQWYSWWYSWWCPLLCPPPPPPPPPPSPLFFFFFFL